MRTILIAFHQWLVNSTRRLWLGVAAGRSPAPPSSAETARACNGRTGLASAGHGRLHAECLDGRPIPHSLRRHSQPQRAWLRRGFAGAQHRRGAHAPRLLCLHRSFELARHGADGRRPRGPLAKGLRAAEGRLAGGAAADCRSKPRRRVCCLPGFRMAFQPLRRPVRGLSGRPPTDVPGAGHPRIAALLQRQASADDSAPPGLPDRACAA